MKLENKGEAFQMLYGGSDINVPAGKFDCTVDSLAHHIVSIAKKWGKDVEIIDSTVIPVTKAIEQKNEDKKESLEKELVKLNKEEEKKTETQFKEMEKPKMGRPPKTK